MRIQFLQSVAGLSWCYLPREIHDVPTAIAQLYIAHGVAVAIEPEASPEEAAVLASERTAVLRRPRAAGTRAAD
jgi:hypothetical protein